MRPRTAMALTPPRPVITSHHTSPTCNTLSHTVTPRPCTQVDVGEPEPRTIVSGLVKFVPVEEMTDRKASMQYVTRLSQLTCLSRMHLPRLPTSCSSKAAPELLLLLLARPCTCLYSMLWRPFSFLKLVVQGWLEFCMTGSVGYCSACIPCWHAISWP